MVKDKVSYAQLLKEAQEFQEKECKKIIPKPDTDAQALLALVHGFQTLTWKQDSDTAIIDFGKVGDTEIIPEEIVHGLHGYTLSLKKPPIVRYQGKHYLVVTITQDTYLHSPYFKEKIGEKIPNTTQFTYVQLLHTGYIDFTGFEVDL